MRLVIFDLDGTISDPREGFFGCIREALGHLGIQSPPDHELSRFIGPPLIETLSELIPPERSAEIPEAIRLYRQAYDEWGALANHLYDGIPGALESIASSGARLHVATYKAGVFAQRIIERFGLSRYFAGIHGTELTGSPRSKADLIAAILRAENAGSDSRAVMVGDRRQDAVAAASHGIPTLGVTWGFGSREELLASGCVALCEQVKDLPAALARIRAITATPFSSRAFRPEASREAE